VSPVLFPASLLLGERRRGLPAKESPAEFGSGQFVQSYHAPVAMVVCRLFPTTVYLPGLINAMIITMLTCTNTLTWL
jgi:hypothetical protein